MIIAKKLKIIYHNGTTIDYTHLTRIETISDIRTPYLMIDGESLDNFDMARISYDKHFIKDINLMITEFYIPKV